ncbi:MAG: 16S rRNA (cytosine(1402)-N(4))-methyltransferase RsmH [Spirochaetes bacterium]|nr:16S rRNA (cytosine(1402)-N(4))-methyltransferase RsmH [Spirochaetota bacterium]MBN2772167.1 16S rRNA (cytosine(1402)-N(4))-methyltransferase RsmH [Spirochaetota bacterium]
MMVIGLQWIDSMNSRQIWGYDVDPRDLAHYPVFYREIVEMVRPSVEDDNSVVVDCTVGSGGHSQLLLETFTNIKVIGFERDPGMAEKAKKNLLPFADRFSLINDNFSRFAFYMAGLENRLAAVIYDFGISSWHLDDDDRGFAIKENSPLDMRLDPGCKVSAYDIVNNFAEKDIADIIYRFGEERHSRKIARYICFAREKEPIRTTDDLSRVVLRAKPVGNKKKGSVHPATKTFQALRIYVNNELESIRESLSESWKYCKAGGRIAAISFHSLEDRIVKNSFRSLATGCYCDDHRYCQCDRISRVKLITRKPLVPSEQEMSENNRSRSAKLRVCERIME